MPVIKLRSAFNKQLQKINPCTNWISFLAIFSIANVANAEQINFTGHFVTGSGGIQVNDAFFRGSLILTLRHPIQVDLITPITINH